MQAGASIGCAIWKQRKLCNLGPVYVVQAGASVGFACLSHCRLCMCKLEPEYVVQAGASTGCAGWSQCRLFDRVYCSGGTPARRDRQSWSRGWWFKLDSVFGCASVSQWQNTTNLFKEKWTGVQNLTEYDCIFVTAQLNLNSS